MSGACVLGESQTPKLLTCLIRLRQCYREIRIVGFCFYQQAVLHISDSKTLTRRDYRNVQVTLQILEALIEKNPKDLPLFATSVLKILDLILRSNDITMVESSVPTFEAFCVNHDASSLFADQAYLLQYEGIVSQYAAFASTRGFPGKTQPSKPVALRWRNSGLEAIKSIASSDALSSVAGRQFEVVVPMILENLWTDNEDFLEVLLKRAHMEEKVNTDQLLKRRLSNSTVRTVDAGDTNPIALSGSAGDVDKLAEEDIGVLAMQCLKQIFVMPNRSQILAATTALLRFIEERVKQDEAVVKTHNGQDSGWAIKMLGLISRWAPVQDRYVILVTTMDTMVRMQLKNETLQQHLVLTAMIGSLLRSDVNLIGLSVMDVLLGLIQHMKRLVQMPGDPTGGSDNKEAAVPAETIAAQRKELLGRIQQTMGDLATHVYYADQISDMISAILLRLKPTKNNSTATSTPHNGEQTDTDEKTSTDNQIESLFSLTVAKTTALKAVKLILTVANPKIKTSGNISLSRNRVPIQVWEGTHWLLRDPDGLVRKAYGDALTTWLDRETNKADLVARDDSRKTKLDPLPAGVGRRVISATSTREKPVKTSRTVFLQLLHVAIYDNALQFMDYETDIALLHVLLAKLVIRLGVNAARFGVPMIFRLQEDIQDAEMPLQKVRLGSLCHGYFWALTEKFDFEASVVGRAIHNEIIRRRTKHFWVEGVQVPPPVIELVGTPGMARPEPRMSPTEVESEALLPFDDRISLVGCICTSYNEDTLSPPTSPAVSPGRSFTMPILGSGTAPVPTQENGREIPSIFREQMLFEWSREAAMIAIQASNKSASLSGSRAGTTGTANRNRLMNGGLANGNGDKGPSSPLDPNHKHRPQSQPPPAAASHLAPINSMMRKTSVRSGISPNGDSTSSRGGGYVTSIDQLKMALSGDVQGPPLTGVRDDSSSDDSMVSYDMTTSELSFNPPINNPGQTDGSPVPPRSRSMSRERKGSDGASLGPLNSNPLYESKPIFEGDEENVPPMPPLPSVLAGEKLAQSPQLIAVQDYAVNASPAPAPVQSRKQRSVRSRGTDSVISSVFGGEDPLPTMDLQSLLKGIDSRAGEHSLGNVTRPPY